MIFVFPQWRFGNQVFQYMFAKYIAKKNEKIITSTAPYFDIIEESNKHFFLIPNKKYFRYINFILNKIFLVLWKFRIITHIKQNKILKKWFLIESKWYSEKKWLLSSIKYVDWFFIYEDQHIIWKKIKIKDFYLQKAKNFLAKIPAKNKKIFVHIRRWDYLDRSVMWQKNMTLPISFYKNQIEYLLQKNKDISFIFLSDDIDFCKKEFDYISKITYYSNNDLWTDFALMTLCDGAIISASSLSYLWAYFIKNPIVLFAPNHFLGFKIWSWYPDWIFTKKMDFVKIN